MGEIKDKVVRKSKFEGKLKAKLKKFKIKDQLVKHARLLLGYFEWGSTELVYETT
jgi:hypothetical protein